MKKILLISLFLLSACDKASEKLGCIDGCDIPEDPTEVEVETPPVDEPELDNPEFLTVCGQELIRFPSGIVVRVKKLHPFDKYIVLKINHVYHVCKCSYVIDDDGEINVL